MSEEYTPTTNDVRTNFCPPYERLGLTPDTYSAHEYDDAANAAFDRMLETVRHKAWEEGRIAGHDEANGWGDAVNPYRKEQKQ